MPHSGPVDVAIVGAGASGVMVAAQIVRQSRAAGSAVPSVLLIESAEQPGCGVAYATAQAEHLLNVAAANMSILPDQPQHFVQWLVEQGHPPQYLGDHYIPRRLYGRYLQAQLEQAQTHGVRLRQGRVVALESGGIHRLQLADGHVVDADAVVLAIGNTPHRLPVPHEGIDVVDAWNDAALAGIPTDSHVAIVGAGLSMVDAVLTLSANHHRGRIDVFSRHGLGPLAHDHDHDHAELDIDAFAALRLRVRLHHLRRWIAEHPQQPWQATMRSLRGPAQRLWQSLDQPDQRRFLRHVVRYWDIHRHRIAPQVAATLDAMRAIGQLHLHAGRPRRLVMSKDRVDVVFVPRHESRETSLQVDCVINATGLETHLEQSSDPLLRSLIATGSARPGPHGRGLDTSADGSVLDRSGAAHPALHTLGSPRIGSLWESIAIPDLRVHAADLATQLLRLSSRSSAVSRGA